MPRYRISLHLPDGRSHTAIASPDEYLLDAALADGVSLPYRCLQGWCLTCAARLLEGEVDQRDSRRYYAADREAGFVLPCTGRPVSDVTLQTHARDAMREARAARGLPFPRGDWGRGS